MAGHEHAPARGRGLEPFDDDSPRLRATALLLLALDSALVWMVPRIGSAALERSLRDSYAETLRVFHNLRRRGVE